MLVMLCVVLLTGLVVPKTANPAIVNGTGGKIKHDITAGRNVGDNPKVVSWGLKVNTRGETPEPPAEGVRLLKEHNGIFVGDGIQRKIYFTFDLGYEAGYTAEVLDTLKAHQIKAVFFLCGNYLKQTELIKRILVEGHSIGNHTARHKDLPSLSNEEIRQDIAALQEDFTEKYGETMRFFRPPQGRFCARTLKIAADQNLKTVLWSVAIADWGKAPIDAKTNAAKIASRLHPGAIILMHITNAGTPEMLKLLIPQVVEREYIIGTPSEL